MCFWRETEKVHFSLANEHDAPVCRKLRKRKRAEVFPNRGHFCGQRKCRDLHRSYFWEINALNENLSIFEIRCLDFLEDKP